MLGTETLMEYGLSFSLLYITVYCILVETGRVNFGIALWLPRLLFMGSMIFVYFLLLSMSID